jgi:hypothetical protein
VHLINDSSLVRTEPLKQAIAKAVQTIMRRSLPDSVYVPA